jgi:hypothetical protein
VQASRRERFYSRPATAERSDGSRPTLMETLYNICPAAFGPPVQCQLAAEGVQPQEDTLQCNSELERPPASADQQDTPQLAASMHNDYEDSCGRDRIEDVATTAVHKPQAPDITGAPQGLDVEAAAELPECKDRNLVALGSETLDDTCADADQPHPKVGGDSNVAVTSSVGLIEGSELASAVCESAVEPDAVGGVEPQGVVETDVQYGGEHGAGDAAVSEGVSEAGVPSGSPGAQADLPRADVQGGVGLPAPPQERGAVRQPVKGGLCPPRGLSGCLHEGVEVQVAGVRAKPPGGSGELLQVSLLALHELLHAPDLFLYIVVLMPPELFT